jgi:purine-binding chemotaxis protein CheW
MATSQQFCTFFLDGNLFGVPVPRVQEVIHLHEITRVPLAPEAVEGMMNLRGQIVIAIDLRRRLSLPARAHAELPVNVVMRTTEGAVSLLVDEIGDVVEVQDSSFEYPPETLRGAMRSMILGVHKLEGRLLHVLDSERACQIQGSAESVGASCAEKAVLSE